MLHRCAKAYDLLRQGNLSHLVSRLGQSAHERGWAMWLTTMLILYAGGVADEIAFGLLPEFTFSLADAGDVRLLAACSGLSESGRLKRLFRQFFADGHLCAMVLSRAGIAGYMWGFRHQYVLTLDDYGPRSIPIRLQPSAVFTGNAYVRPELRGRGLFRRLKDFVMRQFPPATQFYSSINALNWPSLRVSEVLGFEAIASLRFMGLGHSTALWWQPAHEPAWRAAGLHWSSRSARVEEGRLILQDQP